MLKITGLGPHSLNNSTASVVYDHLVSCDLHPWSSWGHIWKLCVFPRTKIFVWKLAHGRLPTSAYLYDLNIGPRTPSYFCSLEPETTSHLIWNCSKIIPSWVSLLAALNLDTNHFVDFSSFAWLTCRFTSKNLVAFIKALVATTAWIIWKDRYNLVFKGWAPKFHSNFSRAWSYCTDYFKAI